MRKQIEKIPDTSTSAIIVSNVIVAFFEVAQAYSRDMVYNTTEEALKH